MDNEKYTTLLSCEHMKLRVPKNEIHRYKNYLWEINAPGKNAPGKISELKKELLRIDKTLFEQEIYAPWCQKLDQSCLAISPAMMSRSYTPISIILISSKRILKCEHIKLSKAASLEDFILNKIDTDYL